MCPITRLISSKCVASIRRRSAMVTREAFERSETGIRPDITNASSAADGNEIVIVTVMSMTWALSNDTGTLQPQRRLVLNFNLFARGGT
jgi:hypothetical protein